jgi:hypothetical protein
MRSYATKGRRQETFRSKGGWGENAAEGPDSRSPLANAAGGRRPEQAGRAGGPTWLQRGRGRAPPPGSSGLSTAVRGRRGPKKSWGAGCGGREDVEEAGRKRRRHDSHTLKGGSRTRRWQVRKSPPTQGQTPRSSHTASASPVVTRPPASAFPPPPSPVTLSGRPRQVQRGAQVGPGERTDHPP